MKRAVRSIAKAALPGKATPSKDIEKVQIEGTVVI
jgi:hypothetical protein